MAEPRGPRNSRSSARGSGARTRDAANGGGVAAEAATGTMKGIALIVIAVLVGVVMLQFVDEGDAPESSGSGSTTTSTTVAPGGTTTTTGDPATLVQPAALRIQVLNGRGVQGAAGEMTTALEAKGYTNHADPADADARTGNAVTCKDGLDGEAAVLATQVGDAVVELPFPTPAPANAAADVQCLVILGAAA
jgi:hypothetical protein